MRLVRRSLAAHVLLASCAAVAAGSAAATSAPSGAPPFAVTVQPASGPVMSYFVVGAQPGRATTAGRLLLSNRIARTVQVLLDPVDAQTATSLGSAYAVRGLAAHGPATWTRLGARGITLPGNATRNVTVDVRVPPGAAPGQYLSGISVQAQGAGAVQPLRSNVSVASIVRYAVGVEVALSGPRRPRIALTGATLVRRPAGLAFVLAAGNVGNVILTRVTGSIVVTQGARTVASATLGPGTFVTGTSISYPLLAPREQPSEGTEYRLRAEMRYTGGVARLDRRLVFGAQAAKVQHEFGGPAPRAPGGQGLKWWAIALIGLGAAALVGLIAIVLVRRRRRSRAGVERPEQV
jgi:hypothetical protein